MNTHSSSGGTWTSLQECSHSMGAFLRSYTPVMPFQGGGGGFLSITLKKNFTIYCILFQGQGNWFLVSRFSDPACQDIAAPDDYTGKAHGRPEIQHLVFRRKTGEENWETPSGWHSRGQSTAQFHFTGEPCAEVIDQQEGYYWGHEWTHKEKGIWEHN